MPEILKSLQLKPKLSPWIKDNVVNGVNGGRLSVDLTYEKTGDASVPKSYRKVVCDSKERSTFDSQIELSVSIINERTPF